MNTEARVGMFITAGLILLGGMILKLGDVSLKRTYPLRVSFSDVAGLPDKSVVKLSGVEVGKVRHISLDGDKAIVDIVINRGVEVYRDAHFRIGSTSIIGSKFLQIDQGHRSAGPLAAGEAIEGEVGQPLERLMADALKSVQGLLDELKGSLGQKGTLIQNLQASTQNMRDLTANMNDLMATVKPDLEHSLKKSSDVMDKLDQLLAKTNELAAKLNTSSGTVGALISDVEMKDNVKATVANFKDASASAKDALGRFGRFRFYWNATARNDPEARTTKGDIGLRIVPQEGKFYYIGASNLGTATDAPKTSDFETKNTIDAVLGWYGKWWEFYAGSLRSTFGLGGRLTPFPDTVFLKRFSLVGQAYDFGRNRTIFGHQLNNPDYDAGIEVQVQRYVRLGARVQDIAAATHYQTTANVLFEDKDIAYFFGLVSFSGGAKSK